MTLQEAVLPIVSPVTGALLPAVVEAVPTRPTIVEWLALDADMITAEVARLREAGVIPAIGESAAERVARVIGSREVSDARRESLARAIELGADDELLRLLVAAPRLARRPTIEANQNRDRDLKVGTEGDQS